MLVILQQLVSILQAYISILTGGGGGSVSGGTSAGGLPSPVMVSKVVVPTRTTTWDPVTNQRISGLDPRVTLHPRFSLICNDALSANRFPRAAGGGRTATARELSSNARANRCRDSSVETLILYDQ